ncbi:MAG: hypothetical protein R3F49_16945 [Planctomycetota bacterium]
MQHHTERALGLSAVLAALVALAIPAPLQAGPLTLPGVAALTDATTDDVPPKDDEKKNEVTVWVLDASGKG